MAEPEAPQHHEEETLEAAESGASKTSPKQCSAFRKNEYIVLKGRPCRVLEVRKPGHAKVHIVGLDVFTSKKYEYICPSTHNMEALVVERKAYQLMSINDDGFVSLLNLDTCEEKKDLKLAEGVLGQQIRDAFEKGENGILVTVGTAMGEEAILAFKLREKTGRFTKKKKYGFVVTSAASSSAKLLQNSAPTPALTRPTVLNGQSTKIMPTLGSPTDQPSPSSKNAELSLRSLLNRRTTQRDRHETAESIINKSSGIFRTLVDGKAEAADFGRVCRAYGLPGCLKKALFAACCGGRKFVVQYDLTRFWTSLGEDAGDEAVVLVRLLSSSDTKRFLATDDFVLLVQAVVDEHPGLAFLREEPEFCSRYIQTVIARIFFCINRSWSGRITAAEIRRSNFIEILHRLDDEEDINRITQFFSYEHFHVIYCTFLELVRDHDLLIDKEDLSRFDDYALSRRAVDRIFSAALNNDRQSLNEGKMTYPQFVKFILAEKDKRHPTSIEYWFRCMDLDGDGILSIYELQYFYEEQAEKMTLCGVEPMPFVNILCQVMDMVRPQTLSKITLADLKHCKMAPVFFDTFLNRHRTNLTKRSDKER